MKRSKSSSIPEFKLKGSEILFDVNNEILEDMNQAIRSIEKDNMERFQKMLQDSGRLLLKQQKLTRVLVRKKDG